MAAAETPEAALAAALQGVRSSTGVAVAALLRRQDDTLTPLASNGMLLSSEAVDEASLARQGIAGYPLVLGGRVEGLLVLRGRSASWLSAHQARLLPLVDLTAMAVRNTRLARQSRLADNEIQFQAGLLDAVEQAVVATDMDGTITYWNRFAETLYGWTAAEARGRAARDFLVSEDLHSHASEIMVRLRAGHSWTGEFTMRRRDGGCFPALVTDSPIRDGDGKVIGVVGVSIDITRQKLAESGLRESNHVLNSLISAVPTAIMMLEADGTVSSWNPAAERMYGWTADEVLGRCLPGLSEVGLTELQQRLADAVIGSAPQPVEIRRRRKNGEEFEATIWTIRLDDPKTSGRCVGIVLETTEQKRAEARRIELAREHAARVEAEAARQRQAFLAAASTRLASSLDYRDTLQQVAALAVPGFADSCIVHMLNQDGVPLQAAVTHANSEMVGVLAELQQRYPLDPASVDGVARVLRTGQVVHHAHVSESERIERARDAHHAELLRALGSRSAIIVPLAIRGRILGALSFVRSISLEPYASEDVATAQELARSAAQAIDNARLYGAAQHELAERKRAQTALHASEERYRSVVASLQEGIVLQVSDGSIAACNESAEHILGLNADQMMGRTPIDSGWRLIREDGSPFEAEFHPAMVTVRTGYPQTDVLAGIVKTSGITWMSLNSQPLTLGETELGRLGVVTSLTDITERRRLLDQIQTERAKLAGVIDSMTDGLLLLSKDGLIDYCNQRAGALLGFEENAVVGMHAEAALATIAHLYAEPQTVGANWTSAVARVDERPSFEMQVTDGPSRELQVRLFRVPRGSRPDSGVGVLVRDVTAERELSRAKDELVAMVSHELASPATILVSYAEMLANETIPEPDRQEMLDTMVEEGQRLSAMIRDFMEVQRIQRGGSQMNARAIDLSVLLRHAAKVARSDTAHPFVLEVPDELPLVHADPERVQQILANLLSNAQKYTPAGGHIRLSARQLDTAVEVCIADDGLGIPATALPRLFDRFYRVQAEDRRGIKGTGLGLAIVKQLVDALGGQISVASDGPGAGSRFWFTLPVASSKLIPQPSPQVVAVVPHMETPPLRVLVVDDNPTTGAALAALLHRDGHHVAAVSSGEEALQRLLEEAFDIVISDLDLGHGMTGWDLAARVRATWPHVRFVMSSGAITSNPSEAYRRGVDSILPRPYRPEDLRLLLTGYGLWKARAA